MDLGPITYQVVILWQCLPAVVENAALCQSVFSFTYSISWTQIPAPQGGAEEALSPAESDSSDQFPLCLSVVSSTGSAGAGQQAGLSKSRGCVCC